jgi:hypothetical protein
MTAPRLARALVAEVCLERYTSSCTSQGSTLGTTNYVAHYVTLEGLGRATGRTAQQAPGEGGGGGARCSGCETWGFHGGVKSHVFWARDAV